MAIVARRRRQGKLQIAGVGRPHFKESLVSAGAHGRACRNQAIFYRISTGPLEGTNNKIKTMQRMAYGYRDMEFFKLKIYAIHKARYELVG